ncbi:MAG: type 4a pilus biogenesis protein PilO [Gemmatimonadales bacterium]
MAMSARDRMLLKWMVALLPLGGVVYYWIMIRPDQQTQLAAVQVVNDSLRNAVAAARADLASGTVEQLRQRVADYEITVGLMRGLVPTGDEVANLIDDISNRAKVRNVTVAELSPQGFEEAGAFRATRYRFTVLGKYDDVGGFLSDIASLPRIMVPRDVSLAIAAGGVASAIGDDSGSLLRASFNLRTFVKQASEGDGAGGAGGSR